MRLLAFFWYDPKLMESTVDLMQEANHAFELNVRLFASFSSSYAAEQEKASVLDTPLDADASVVQQAAATVAVMTARKQTKWLQTSAALVSCVVFALIASWWKQSHMHGEVEIRV